jgi:hypothetical protein
MAAGGGTSGTWRVHGVFHRGGRRGWRARLHRPAARRELHLVLLLLSVATYLYQAAVGVILIINPNDSNQVLTVAYLLIASFAVAVTRAWALMQGRTARHVSVK